MIKVTTATIAEVEEALAVFKVANEADPSLEGRYAKKLGTVVDGLTVKDGVTKDLNQAYTYAEKWWAVNVVNGGSEGCTVDNKFTKIKEQVQRSTAYLRLIADPQTKVKVEGWFAEKFPTPVTSQAVEAA